MTIFPSQSGDQSVVELAGDLQICLGFGFVVMFVRTKTIAAVMQTVDIVAVSVAHVVVVESFFSAAIVNTREAFVSRAVLHGDGGAHRFAAGAAVTLSAATLFSVSTATAATVASSIGDMALEGHDEIFHVDVFGFNGARARGSCGGNAGRGTVVVARTHRFQDVDDFVEFLALFDSGGPKGLKFGVFLDTLGSGDVALALGSHALVACGEVCDELDLRFMSGSGVGIPLAAAFVNKAGLLQHMECVHDPQAVGDRLIGARSKLLELVLAGKKGLKRREGDVDLVAHGLHVVGEHI